MSVEDLTRNAVDVLPKGGLEEKLKLGRPLRVKLGIDVTSPDLHVGRGIPLQRMRAFQDAGHIGVFIVGYVIDFLAGTFGARKNLESAMKVSAYAPTAAWVAGVFNLIPGLGFLAILGLYSLYLLYTGIAALMRPAASNALIYTIAVIVCAIIVWVVILAIPAMLFGMGMKM